MQENRTGNSDEDLWAILLQGDKDALYQLYTRFYHPLLYFGLKYTADPGFVKDSINQLFLYLWEKRESLQAARNVRNYLYTSLRRQLARRALQPVHVSLSDEQEQPLEPSREESWIAEQELDHRSALIAAAVNRLPARQKQLLFMKYYESLSYEEIAARTGLSVRTVYNKVYEAVTRLRQDLEKHSSRSGKTSLSALLPLILSFC